MQNCIQLAPLARFPGGTRIADEVAWILPPFRFSGLPYIPTKPDMGYRASNALIAHGETDRGGAPSRS
jgi:hypothetical protein